MIRKLWPLAFALVAVAFVGCNSGEQSTNDTIDQGQPPPNPPSSEAEYKADSTKTPGPAGNTPGSMPAGYPAPEPSTGGDAPKTEGDAAMPEAGDTTAPAAGETPEANADATLSDDEVAAIKELPAEEAEIALAQKLCPIQGGHLGEMGKPYKVMVGDEIVFLCCEGCEGKFNADPEAALAKARPKKSD